MAQQRPATRHLQLTQTWPYWVGGVALALVNTLILALEGAPWRVTSMLTHVGSRTLQLMGLEPQNWRYFAEVGRGELLAQFGWWDSTLWLNLGVIGGAVLASLAAGEFYLRPWPRQWRKVLLSLGGGLLMGYGARLALGCSVGALIGSIPSYSLHGWIFAVAVLVGALAGIQLFRRIL